MSTRGAGAPSDGGTGSLWSPAENPSSEVVVLYSGPLGRSYGRSCAARLPSLAWLGVYAVVCRRVGGFVEPYPRAARARAARARSGYPPAPGEIQEKVRSRHQSGERADGARWAGRVTVVSGPGAAGVGAYAQARGRGRGRDLRIRESPRGDVAVENILQSECSVSFVRT